MKQLITLSALVICASALFVTGCASSHCCASKSSCTSTCGHQCCIDAKTDCKHCPKCSAK